MTTKLNKNKISKHKNTLTQTSVFAAKYITMNQMEIEIPAQLNHKQFLKFLAIKSHVKEDFQR